MKTKKQTEKQKREARNKYSRDWKKAHKKEVAATNAAWYAAQKKVRSAKAKARKAPKKAVAVRTPQAA